jgi:hypothetical protein
MPCSVLLLVVSQLPVSLVPSQLPVSLVPSQLPVSLVPPQLFAPLASQALWPDPLSQPHYFASTSTNQYLPIRECLQQQLKSVETFVVDRPFKVCLSREDSNW